VKLILNNISLLLLFVSCSSISQTSSQADNIIQNCKFVVIASPFSMRILEYVPGCYCGTRSCASNCVGINSNNDTIRVLSLCNTDTTFKISQIVFVNPQPQPKYQVTIAQYWISEGNNTFLSELERKKINTIYGNLSRR